MWKELKWYIADREYSFSAVQALVECKNGGYKVATTVKKGQKYCPMPLIEDALNNSKK